MGRLGGKMGSQRKEQLISADFWSGRIFPQKLGFGWFHHLFTSWKNGGRWEKMWFSPKIRISRKTNVFSPAKRCGFRAQNRYFGLSASTGMPPKHWRYLCHGRGQATLSFFFCPEEWRDHQQQVYVGRKEVNAPRIEGMGHYQIAPKLGTVAYSHLNVWLSMGTLMWTIRQPAFGPLPKPLPMYCERCGL